MMGHNEMTSDEQIQQLQEELNRTAFHLLAVNQAMKMLGSVTQLQQTLDMTVDMFVEITRALWGCVLLPERGRSFVVRAAKGADTNNLVGAKVSIPPAALDWFRQRRSPVVVEGESNPQSDIIETLSRQMPHPCALYLPLMATDRLIGLIALGRKFRNLSYTHEELEVLSTLAAQTAIAIENAKLVHRLKGKVQLANQELREANRALSLEMAKLQAIVEGMADGLFVTDAKGRITFVNPAVRDYLGWGDNAVEGMSLRQCTPTETLTEVVNEVTSGQAQQSERELVITEPLRRVFTTRATALRDQKERLQGVVAVLSDITALKELADMKADFVSFIAHELRTPLTSIQGFINTLSYSPPGSFDQEEVSEFYEIIHNECVRLLGMINELLDVSRLEAGRPLPVSIAEVDLRPLVADVVKMQQYYIKGGHTLITDIPDDLPTVRADKDRVIQILTNLLSNAIKYSPNGGEVTTRVVAEDEEVIVSVSDQGLGIKPEDMSRLFTRYHRVITEDTARIRGTGLGLFLTKQLVELQNGRIWCESEYGKGSTFFFSLPRQRLDAAAS